ncbi:uncharacterized protein LOC129940814 [Eupeodes corollae]|uniref:uncharacterized protein LOC129940814 n=1 Tax=Eupeodes corollae TaxID=290404 RepID=UPI00248F7514|nr:uncharacterized protein LOC129940814 [Eupeodes corollae]
MSDCTETKRLPTRSELLVKLARSKNKNSTQEWTISSHENPSYQNVPQHFCNTSVTVEKTVPSLGCDCDLSTKLACTAMEHNTASGSLQLNSHTPNFDEKTSVPGCSSTITSGFRLITSNPQSDLSSDSTSDSELGDFSADDDCKDPNYCTSGSSGTSDDLQPSSPTPTPVEIDSTEKEKPSSRKRKNRKNEWTRTKAKIARNFGKSYVSSSKTHRIIEERKMGPACNCRLGCSSKINEENRLKLFSKYWEYGCSEKQRNFIAASMIEIKPKYRYTRVRVEEGSTSNTRKPRQNNNAFYFNIENSRIRICKTFFKSTLGINDRPIRTVLDKKHQYVTNMVESDLRGKHTPSNKTNDSILKGIKDHIDQIPRIPSHYCRANSNKEYVDGSMSVAEIHRNYVEQCRAEKVPFAKYKIFHQVFVNNYNIAFHHPKKDQCEDCIGFENSENKEHLQEKYDEHLAEKILSREEKERDKESANETNIVAVYDLQAVLQCPKGESSNFYYVSKLNIFNFTICQLKSKEVNCFVWHEGAAGRGANEIGSCVFMYLKSLQENSTQSFDVVFYSDNCCGQQKKQVYDCIVCLCCSNIS